jgi:hypothetical protein
MFETIIIQSLYMNGSVIILRIFLKILFVDILFLRFIIHIYDLHLLLYIYFFTYKIFYLCFFKLILESVRDTLTIMKFLWDSKSNYFLMQLFTE